MVREALKGTMAVATSARLVRHYRYAEERLMRLMGGWIALTPELPAKIMLARHVWDCAQHADAWGKRLAELRSPLHQGEAANERFVRFMDLLESMERPGETIERLVGAHRVLMPHLLAAYQRHFELANPIYETPTRRLLERCLTDKRRQVAAGQVMVRGITSDAPSAARANAWKQRLTDALLGAGGVTGDGEVPLELPQTIDPTESAGDLVGLDSRFDRRHLESDLVHVVDRHCQAVLSSDWPRVHLDISNEAREEILAEYQKLKGLFSRYDLVACAKVGGYRFTRIRFSGQSTKAVALQWRRPGGRWVVVKASQTSVDA